MFRFVTSRVRGEKYYQVGVVVVFLMVVGVAFVWVLTHNVPALSGAEDVAQGQPMTKAKVESVDVNAYNVHLYELERFNRAVEATQTERAAPPDAYEVHRYELERFAQTAEAAQSVHTGSADVFNAHRYELERFEQAAEALK